MLKLYYIRAEANEPGDRDLFVRAVSPQDALTFWCGYYADDNRHSSDLVAISLIPEGTTAGAIDWQTVTDHLTEAQS